MTHSERIKMLEQFLKDDPSDPFNLYALALEYQKLNLNEATELFEQLLTKHPNYLPTYYMAGINYVDQANPIQALSILQKGLVLAKSQKNMTAARELKSAIENLED